ncbi:MAG: ATP-binding protein [Treponema sp.]|nr:ATP-binding protein [Treponema sp.]
MKRRLPIGIQDFISIREDGFIYVDKTAEIHQLISGSGRAFFLSRPRRFGKSLLCSTLEAIFEGRRDLFGEMAGRPALAINSLEWEWKKHPIIRLDLNPGNYLQGMAVLASTLNNALNNIARSYNMELRGQYAAVQFSNLIQDLHEQFKEKVVVLVDEYDKPLLSTMEAADLHIEMRNELKGFYGVLKSSDKDLQFVFLTGVTKFSHVSVFSDLNHLVDLSLDSRYADICGLTQEEVEQNFGPEIETILNETNLSREDYLDKLRRYYNGYRFSEKLLTVYNPFGLLNHFDKNGKFLPYWYESGTPTFLINLIIKQKINIVNLNNMRVGYEEFQKYDIENMRAEPVLYQSGYLTIADYDAERNRFILDYPNEEVRTSFASSLVRQYLQAPPDRSRALTNTLPDALDDGDADGAMNAIRQFLASIPYDIIQERENYYETAIHLIFTMLGLNCRSEVRIAAGRIDTLVETKRFVYCFEFKLNGTAEEALIQINTKEYLLPWIGSGKQLFKIGVSFDSEKRNIGEWKAVAVM